jgi:hypothetical protein
MLHATHDRPGLGRIGCAVRPDQNRAAYAVTRGDELKTISLGLAQGALGGGQVASQARLQLGSLEIVARLLLSRTYRLARVKNDAGGDRRHRRK